MGKRIEDARTFPDRSIGRRLEIIETAVQLMREIWDLGFQERFYDGITQIIVEELAPVPEIQGRVIQRLTELNNSRGMTVNAEVG